MKNNRKGFEEIMGALYIVAFMCHWRKDANLPQPAPSDILELIKKALAFLDEEIPRLRSDGDENTKLTRFYEQLCRIDERFGLNHWTRWEEPFGNLLALVTSDSNSKTYQSDVSTFKKYVSDLINNLWRSIHKQSTLDVCRVMQNILDHCHYTNRTGYEYPDIT